MNKKSNNPRLETMRKAIMDVYKGIRWKERCSRMQPNQVIAIYRSFEKNGKFDKHKATAKDENYQMTIYDYIWSESGVVVR